MWLVFGMTVAQAEVVSANGDKCSAKNDVGIATWELIEECPSGNCDWTFRVPLDTCGVEREHAVAYLSGYEIDGPEYVVAQIHELALGIAAQQVVMGSAGPELELTVHYHSFADGDPVIVHEDFVRVLFEVISYDPGLVEHQVWTQATTGPGGHAASNFSDPYPRPLAFSALTSFAVTATRDATGLDGVNLSEVGIRTTNYPLIGDEGIDSTVECFAQGDHGYANHETSCKTEHVAVYADPSLLKRASLQPVAFSSPQWLDPAPSTTPIKGKGKGAPACGLSTFVFRADDPWVQSFKYNKLGFMVRDCDKQLMGTGLKAQVSANGAWCSDPWGNPDQTEQRSTWASPSCWPMQWSGEFGLDTATLH